VIELTRLNGQVLVVNVDVIKLIETTPDTVLTLTTGDKLPVKESAEVVIEKCIAFKSRLFFGAPFVKEGPKDPLLTGDSPLPSDMLQ
jgi:flagellar protein FlbD